MSIQTIIADNLFLSRKMKYYIRNLYVENISLFLLVCMCVCYLLAECIREYSTITLKSEVFKFYVGIWPKKYHFI